jgi:sorbitol-specific phosphotransferase system component IIBC
MQIRAIKTFAWSYGAGDLRNYIREQIYNIDDAHALAMIKNGYASKSISKSENRKEACKKKTDKKEKNSKLRINNKMSKLHLQDKNIVSDENAE